MSQPYTSSASGIGAEPDQQTPLLTGSVGHGDSRSSFNRNQRLSFVRSLPAVPFFRRGSSSSDNSDDVDIDKISSSLAPAGSFIPNAGLEPLESSFAEERRPRHMSKASIRKPSVVPQVDVPNGNQSKPLDHTEDIEEGSVVDEEEESQFRGITPLRFWLVFGVIMGGYFVACFDSTLMASSHPVITSYFEASQAASWLSTVFLITSTAFQPLFGRLSDTIGRKPVFLLSFLLFGLTTLWCALAQSIESFIAARAVCGLGAGGTMSMSLIIVSDLVRIEDRGIYQSHINFAFGLGTTMGAALGGFLCDNLGWRWAFGVQVPFLILLFILGAIFTPSGLGPMLINNGEGGAWTAIKNFDFAGSFFLLLSVSTLILALNLGGNIFPWSSPIVITCFVVCGVTSMILVFAETRAKQPLMPLRLLTKSPIANLVFLNTLGGIASNTVLFNVPLFFQAVLLTSASDSGFRLAFPSVVGSIAGISTGYIITYTRKLKPTLVAGTVIYLLGSIAVTCMPKNPSGFLSILLIAGVPLGQGFVLPNAMLSALAVSAQADQAVVTTTVGLWRNLGVVLGVSVSSLVLQNSLVANLDSRVMGPDKEAVIREVRLSVNSIKGLAQPYQSQVTDAYAASLRVTFLCAVVAAVVMNLICFPVKLPRLRKGKKVAAHAGE